MNEERPPTPEEISDHFSALQRTVERRHEERLERELEEFRVQGLPTEFLEAPWNIEDADVLRRAYEDDGNPLWVWQAIMINPVTEDFPIWVRNYLSGVAMDLVGLSTESDHWKRNEAPRKVAQALGFLKEGRGTAFSSWMAKYWVWAGSKVEELKLADEKEYIAIETVAEKYGLSPSTIRRAWEAYQRITK